MRLEIRAPGDGESATATGMMAEEQRCFLRVVRGEESVPRGATFQDALQVQDKARVCVWERMRWLTGR